MKLQADESQLDSTLDTELDQAPEAAQAVQAEAKPAAVPSEID